MQVKINGELIPTVLQSINPVNSLNVMLGYKIVLVTGGVLIGATLLNKYLAKKGQGFVELRFLVDWGLKLGMGLFAVSMLQHAFDLVGVATGVNVNLASMLISAVKGIAGIK